MSNFKLTWRMSPMLSMEKEKWHSFLRLIDKHKDTSDEIAFYAVDDFFLDETPLDDKRKQTEICKVCFDQLRQRGYTVGINVWPTLPMWETVRMHYPSLRRMVGIDGEVVENIACPVSDEFIYYMCQKYTIFAECGPDFIWVDDDLRFTHMDGNYPCYCDECVKNFKNGAFKNRKELVEALNNPQNRDLRIAWSSYGADRLAKLCSALREAVDKIDPNIDIGLMTVGATHTTFSGDYIEKCMTALRSRRGRPGHDLYSDRLPDKLTWKILEVGRQVLEYPETVKDIYWEEDSYPQGQLAKSFHTRQNEVSLGLMAGCSGIAFNHISMNGDLDRRFNREIDELHALRPRWEKFYEFSKDLGWGGMWPLHSWFMTAKAKFEYAWLKEEPFADGQCGECDITPPEKIGPYGVALTADPKHASAILLSGKTLTALDSEELRRVFSSNVYMDDSALAALEELGLEEWAGVKLSKKEYSAKLCLMTDHRFNGEFAGYSYRRPTGKGHTLIPLNDKVEWLGYRADKFGEGDMCYISKYENALGGKVVVNSFSAWDYTDNPNNLYLFSSIAKWFDCPIRLRWKDPYAPSRVQPYIRTDGQRAAIMLLNASLDTTNSFEIIVKGCMSKAFLLTPDGSEIPLNCHREDENLCINVPTINPWDISFILAK